MLKKVSGVEWRQCNYVHSSYFFTNQKHVQCGVSALSAQTTEEILSEQVTYNSQEPPTFQI